MCWSLFRLIGGLLVLGAMGGGVAFADEVSDAHRTLARDRILFVLGEAIYLSKEVERDPGNSDTRARSSGFYDNVVSPVLGETISLLRIKPDDEVLRTLMKFVYEYAPGNAEEKIPMTLAEAYYTCPASFEKALETFDSERRASLAKALRAGWDAAKYFKKKTRKIQEIEKRIRSLEQKNSEARP